MVAASSLEGRVWYKVASPSDKSEHRLRSKVNTQVVHEAETDPELGCLLLSCRHFSQECR